MCIRFGVRFRLVLGLRIKVIVGCGRYYQAWVELHETYVELHRALIDADANAWAKLDQAKRAQAQVDFLCLEWIQSEYPTEMTEALAEVQAKRDHARAHAHANHPPEKKELDESHFSVGYIL
jgi:hypothetical protein